MRSLASTAFEVLAVALPDYAAVLVIAVPDFASIFVAALRADELPGEHCHAVPPAVVLEQCLHEIKHILLDDGLMAVFDMVLWDLSVVGPALLGQEVRVVGLLEDCRSGIFLVVKDALDRAGVPAFVAPRGRDSHFRQLRSNMIRGFPGYEHAVDEPDDLGSLRIDHKSSVRAFVITEERLVAEGEFAVLEALVDSPFDVLRDAPALFLSKGAHDRQKDLNLAVEGPDVLLLEVDLHTFVP